LPVLVLVTALVALVTSLGAPLIPSIARTYHVPLATGQWVLTAALLTGALATPTMGRLADGPHQRRVIEVALASVVGGCALSAVSGSFAVMVAGRAFQGLGMGLMPVTMAIARRLLPLHRVGRAVAVLSVSAAIGAGLGYPVTTMVAQLADFRAAYWFGAATAGVALVAAAVVLPGGTPGHRRPLDLLGVVTLGGATAGVLVVLSQGHAWGWTSPVTLGLLAGALGLAAVWVLHETRAPDPLIDVRQLAHRLVLTADLSGFLNAVATYLFIPVVVVFVQVPPAVGYGAGASVFVAGLLFVPFSVGTFAASRLVPAWDRHLGLRTMVPFGSLLFAGAALFFLLAPSELWAAFAAAGLAGVGIGFALAALPTFIVRAVPSGETGSAIGLYQVLRATGLAVGSAVAAALLAAFTPAGHQLPSAAGFKVSFAVAAGLCLATAVVSYVIPGPPAGRPPEAREPATVAEN
jgi:MFS family permease